MTDMAASSEGGNNPARTRAGFVDFSNLFFTEPHYLPPFPQYDFAPLTKWAGEIRGVRIFVEWLIHHHPLLIIRVERKKCHLVHVALIVLIDFTNFWCTVCKWDNVAFHVSSIANTRCLLPRGFAFL